MPVKTIGCSAILSIILVAGIPSLARAALNSCSRRQAAERIAATSFLVSNGSVFATLHRPAIAATTTTISPPSWSPNTDLPLGLLETRVNENVNSPVPYGMEGSDILYPAWFKGTWKAVSTTTEVFAPCGIPLFGGNITYQAALDDIGNQLRYECRFLRGGPTGTTTTTTIADREFNVASIAKAASLQIVNIQTASPNKFSCVLSPSPNAPSLLQVDLLTLHRRQETLSATRFDASEVVREIVRPLDPKVSLTQTPSLLKQVETISLYTYDPASDTVSCRQRSAKFLLPSQQNPTALRLWETSRGRPVDVRFYDIHYQR